MKYRKMRFFERNACAQLTAEAYQDYEYFSDYFPEQETRRVLLERLLKTEFAVSGKADILVAEDEKGIAAVAILNAPDFKKPSDISYALHGWLKVLKAGGKERTEKWVSMDNAAKEPCHRLGAGEWYLSSFIVAKEREGRGIGSAFLNEGVIPYVRSKGGRSLVLFTNSQINRRFYEKNGFVQFYEEEFDACGARLGSWSYRKRF